MLAPCQLCSIQQEALRLVRASCAIGLLLPNTHSYPVRALQESDVKMFVDVENQPPVWNKSFTPAPPDARKSSFEFQVHLR